MTKPEIKTKGRADDTDAFVGQRLRELRTAAGLSQDDIAKAVGVTFQQVQKYENGGNRIAAGRLFQFSAALGVPVATFFPDQATADELVSSLTAEVQRLRDCIGWHSQNLKDSLKKGALVK